MSTINIFSENPKNAINDKFNIKKNPEPNYFLYRRINCLTEIYSIMKTSNPPVFNSFDHK